MNFKILNTNGDWGLGIWGLGIGDWAQSPIPNPHYFFLLKLCIYIKIIYKTFYNNQIHLN